LWHCEHISRGMSVSFAVRFHRWYSWVMLATEGGKGKHGH
jgi:hypothetical protein